MTSPLADDAKFLLCIEHVKELCENSQKIHLNYDRQQCTTDCLRLLNQLKSLVESDIKYAADKGDIDIIPSVSGDLILCSNIWHF